MSQKANVIEINGKRYDALSGELLGDTGSAAILNKKMRRSNGVSMDGFMTKKRPNTPQPTIIAPKTAVTPVASTKVRPFSDIVRPAAGSVRRHKTIGSKTLMRQSVTKPATSLRRQTKVQQRTDILVKQPSITVKPKMSSYQLDPKKISRAKQTPKHPDANRYAQPRPALAAAAAPTISIAAPARAAAAAPAVRPAVQNQTLPSRTTDIFEQALARANSYIEKPVARKHTKHRKGIFGGKALSISAASFAALLLVGFFAWQQKAALTMQYAAAKSGVSAKLPGYKPAGFATGKFSYSPGSVAVNFKNNSTGDSFALIEKSSTWDSSALRDSFVASKSRTYQTIDAAGRTIYTYGNNSATWVDNGVWYQVSSKGNLSTNQIVQLALSM